MDRWQMHHFEVICGALSTLIHNTSLLLWKHWVCPLILCSLIEGQCLWFDQCFVGVLLKTKPFVAEKYLPVVILAMIFQAFERAHGGYFWVVSSANYRWWICRTHFSRWQWLLILWSPIILPRHLIIIICNAVHRKFYCANIRESPELSVAPQNNGVIRNPFRSPKEVPSRRRGVMNTLCRQVGLIPFVHSCCLVDMGLLSCFEICLGAGDDSVDTSWSKSCGSQMFQGSCCRPIFTPLHETRRLLLVCG